jgi:hypothetical protein
MNDRTDRQTDIKTYWSTVLCRQTGKRQTKDQQTYRCTDREMTYIKEGRQTDVTVNRLRFTSQSKKI